MALGMLAKMAEDSMHHNAILAALRLALRAGWHAADGPSPAEYLLAIALAIALAERMQIGRIQTRFSKALVFTPPDGDSSWDDSDRDQFWARSEEVMTSCSWHCDCWH